jgi:hypothetical protein
MAASIKRIVKGKPRGRAFTKKVTGEGEAKNSRERLARILAGVN